ncbi:MAG: adenylate/guanylate cyclase domain-containing protein [Gaiellaceae bacterium]
MECTSCGSALPVAARFCPSCGASVEPASPASTEERKVATVLFADLVGSTSLGSSQDPERTRATLDRFYEAMAAEITSAGGTVEKFVGDAVMAVFGAPAAQEDHAERALHAALAMRRRLDELFGGELRLRIGVNTGEVVVGAAREGSSFVTGDAVNVCARLEQNVDPGEILVGERTASFVRGAFEFDEPQRIEAKGKEGGVACRRLVRALTLMRPRGVRGFRSVFVGRETELELLEMTYRRVVEAGEPHLVTLMGDAGIGKTRLVRELWERLGGQPEQPLRRTGRCLPYGQGITYWPLGEILKEHLGILESDSRDAVLGRLGGREMLGLTLGLDPSEEVHPLAARDRLHEAWVEFLGELAAEHPIVVLVEDVHWAEEPLLDLLEQIARDVQGPLLLIGTARPELLESRPAWGGGRRNASLLWLEPLSPHDAGRLIDEELAGALPEHLRALVVEQAEGNPFYAEELIGTLVDQGVLVQDDDGWRANELPAGFSVPDSVHAVLAARIDFLPPVEKSALQAASVIGRAFWEGPVRELLEGARPDFALLEDRDFVRRRPGSSMAGEREYAIKHALTREVAYASLPKAKRARLHAAFAAWLERAVEARDEVAPLLAHHYAEAVRSEDSDLAWADEQDELVRLREKAAAWLRRAGELALARFVLDDAIALSERALEVEEDGPTKAELWRTIGKAHAMRYEGEAFWAAMQKSLDVCYDRATCGDTYSQLAFQTVMRMGMWPQKPDFERVKGWIESAIQMAPAGSRAHARGLIAKAFVSEQDEDAAREAAELAERLGDAELRSYAFEARSASAMFHSRYEDAWGWAQRRFALLEQIDDPDHLMDIQEGAIPTSVATGRLDEARQLGLKAEELAQRLSPHHRVHGVSLRLEVEEVAGGWDTIRSLASSMERAVHANLDTPCARNQRSLLVCAAASQEAGETAEAERLERAAEELGMEGYDYLFEPPRLRLAMLRGNLDRVGELLDVPPSHTLSFGLASRAVRMDALAALRDRERVEREAPDLLRPGSMLEPFALRALGVVREDAELIHQAQERFEELGLGWHAAQTAVLVAQ